MGNKFNFADFTPGTGGTGTIEWHATQPVTTMPHDITQRLRSKGLSQAKALRIYPLWSRGCSIREAASALGVGFGTRTVANYYAAFNNTSTPPPQAVEFITYNQ